MKQLDVHDDWQVADLGDGVRATRLVPDVHVIPGFWKIDGYGAIEDFLLSTFDLVKGQNYHPFPYDWRRDNRAIARLLEAGPQMAECVAGQVRERQGSVGADRPLNGRAHLALLRRSARGMAKHPRSRYLRYAVLRVTKRPRLHASRLPQRRWAVPARPHQAPPVVHNRFTSSSPSTAACTSPTARP